MSALKALCAAGAFAAIASAASAGIQFMTWTPTTDLEEALDLGTDGVWNYGDDYTFDEYNVTVIETWIGNHAHDVEFDIGVGVGVDLVPATSIGFVKTITNNTSFFWSAFQIVLTPGPNSVISDVMANTNAEFGDVDVSMGGNGAWTLLWTQDGGTGVGLGGMTSLDFGFTISGNLEFTMKQTPIPTPGAAALLGMAGLVGIRRRR